jgi:hypothetical protein
MIRGGSWGVDFVRRFFPPWGLFVLAPGAYLKNELGSYLKNGTITFLSRYSMTDMQEQVKH